MMSRILFVLLSAALVHSQAVAQDEVEPNAQCTTPGFMCKNCDTVAACIASPGGLLTQLDVISCPGSCRNGSCVTGEVCNWRPFTCSLGQTGTFPDPYDCTKFHICDGKSTAPLSKICPEDPTTGRPSAYGSETGSCRYPVSGNANCINAPVPRCERNLEVNVLSNDPNLYYICTQTTSDLAPNLYKCPPATVFHTSTFVCS